MPFEFEAYGKAGVPCLFLLAAHTALVAFPVAGRLVRRGRGQGDEGSEDEYSFYEFAHGMTLVSKSGKEVYSNEDEALEAARKLKSAGWTVLPADDPREGRAGFVAFREVDGSEQSVLIQWELFPISEKHVYDNCDPDDLLAALQSPNPILCDDPKALKLGVGSYDPDKRSLKVYQSRLTQVKAMSAESREALMGLRTQLQGELEERRKALQDKLNA